MVRESTIQNQVADFLRYQYPDVLFHSDFGSSVGMSARQGAQKKRQNGGRRGWPDMFIAKPMYYMHTLEDMLEECEQYGVYHGLFLELKKDGTKLELKDGRWANEHIQTQAFVLRKLRELGYRAEFAVGFDEAVRIIKEYLGEPNKQKIEF